MLPSSPPPPAYYGYLVLSCNPTTTQEDAPRDVIYWARENISVMEWLGTLGRQLEYFPSSEPRLVSSAVSALI